jgi:hypothetical protein
MAGGQRFGFGDVEHGRDPPGLELVEQGIVVDERAPGGVDQGGAVHHLVQLGGADHPLGRGQGGGVEADHVAGGEQGGQVDELHTGAQPGRGLGAQVGIGHHDLAVERRQQADDRPAHVRGTHDADALGPVADRVSSPDGGDLGAPQPLAGHEGVLVGPEDGTERVLGHGHGVGGRTRRDQRHPLERGRGDGVAQGAGGVGHHPQPGRPVEEGLVEPDAAPVAEQHLGGGQHLVGPPGRQGVHRHRVEHVADLAQPGQVLGPQRVGLEPGVHRERDLRPVHELAALVEGKPSLADVLPPMVRAVRLARASSCHSGRDL